VKVEVIENNKREKMAPWVIRTPDLLLSAAGGLYPDEPRTFSSSLARNSSRPLPDLKYFSRRMASARVANSSWYTNSHGPRFFVDFVTP
jgi:hypothetical protein